MLALVLLWTMTSCAMLPETTGPRQPTTSQGAKPTAAKLDPAQADRVKNIMLPLIQNMNRPLPLEEVKVGVINSPDINAANAGGGEFYVTVGLLQKASDEVLRGVLAHEVAHADLGHVAKAQALGTGLQLGTILLDRIFPGSGTFTPIIADLGVMRPYSRQEEYAADTHGVEILKRAGFNGKQIMGNTLTWLVQSSGSGGGFFATHPGTEDRIKRIASLP